MGLVFIVAAGLLAASLALAGDNLDYWLHHATSSSKPATEAGGDNPKNPTTTTAAANDRPSRPDALPGAIELSDGKILAGYMYTTADKDFEIFIQESKDITILHKVPFVAILSVKANVEEQQIGAWSGDGRRWARPSGSTPGGAIPRGG